MAPGISHLLGAGPGGKEMAGHWPLPDHRVLVLDKNLEVLQGTSLVSQTKIQEEKVTFPGGRDGGRSNVDPRNPVAQHGCMLNRRTPFRRALQ